MAWDDEEDTTTYLVVINHEEQYSIWPDYEEIPKGWRVVPIDTAGDRETAARWWLYQLDAPAGYIAALVTQGIPASLSYKAWPRLGISTGLAARL